MTPSCSLPITSSAAGDMSTTSAYRARVEPHSVLGSRHDIVVHVVIGRVPPTWAIRPYPVPECPTMTVAPAVSGAIHGYRAGHVLDQIPVHRSTSECGPAGQSGQTGHCA